jgi:microcystin degradation protein MlrC
MLQAAESHPVNREPMRSLWAQVDGLKQAGAIRDGGLLPVQPWLDLPDLGFSVLIMTNGDPAGARRTAEQLARDAWARRGDFDSPLMDVDAALQAALAAERGPIVISESADGPGAGSPGDSTIVLAAMLEAGVTVPCLLTITDPEAARRCAEAGAGARVTLPVGGKIGRYSAPQTVTGVVRRAGPAQFTFTAGYTGTTSDMGLTAVLDVGAIAIVITEHTVMTPDPALYRAVGLEPADAAIVVVKSPAQFRAAYEPFARGIINLDSPGHSPPNVRRLEWHRRPQPCYPFEDPVDPPIAVWTGARSRS